MLLVIAGVLHLAVHSGPVRQAALARAASWLDARMQWRLTATRLDYSLWTLSASAEGVAIAQRSAALPFFRADRVELRMAAAVLTGRPVFREIRVSRPIVDMTRLESASDEGAGFTGLGSFELGALRVDHLELTWGNPDIVQAVLHDVNILADGSRPGYARSRSIEGGSLTILAPNTTIPLDVLSARIELDGTRVRIASLHAASPDGTLDINGTITLGAKEPLDLAYRATFNAEPATNWFVNGPVMKGHVALDGHVVGPYTSPRATITGNATHFEWTALKDAHMRVRGHIDIDAITLDSVAIDAPIGRLHGRTRLAYDEKPLSSTLSAAWSLRNITTVSAFTETSPDGVPPWPASGTAELRWTDVLPTLADLAGRVDARFSTVGNPDGDMATATLSGANRRWSLAHRMPLPGNTVATLDVRLGLVDLDDLMHTTITGQMTVDTDDAPRALTYLAERGAAVPVGAADMAPAGRLAFAGPVSGTMYRPAWLTRMTGSGLRLADVRDLAAHGTLDIDPSRVGLDALVIEAPGSRIQLDGSLTLDGSDGSGSFDGIVDPSWLLGARVPDTMKVAGSVSVKGSWSGSVDRLAGHLDADAQALSLAGSPLGPVHATVTTDGGQVRIEAQVPELGARLDGTADISQPWRYTASLDLAKTDLARAVALAGVTPAWQNELKAATNATVTAVGTIEDLARSDVTITINALDGTLRDRPFALAGKTTVSRQQGVIEVIAPGISVGGATLLASGRLDSQSPDALGPPISVEVTASLADLLALVPRDSIPEGLTVEGSVRIQAQLPGTTLDTLRAQVQGDVVSATRDGVELARAVHVKGGLENGTVAFSEIRGMLAGAETQVTADFPVGWAAPWLTPQNAAKRDPSPRGHVRGHIDAAIAPVFQALQMPATELDGSATVQFDLSADAPQLDHVAGTLSATSLQVTARKAVFSQAGVSRFRVEDGVVFIEALDVKGYGSNLTATGHVALTDARRHDMRLQGTLSMYLVDALIAPRVGGSATVDLRLGGSLAAPTLEGDVTLEDINSTSATSRLVLADWWGNVTLRSNKVRIEALRGQVNGGLVSISGTLPLAGRDDTADALRISGKDLFLEYPAGLRSLVTADLTVTRRAGEVHIAGEATVASDPYRDPLNKMATLFADYNRPSGRQASSLPAWLGDATLDVSFDTPVPLRLDNSLGVVEMVPQLRLIGSLASPALSGTVDFLDGGHVRLQNRVYDLRDSRLLFSPGDGLVPRLSVGGVTQVGEYTVALRMTGSADTIETNLSSEPPLNERDLRGLLLTGQTADQNTSSTVADNFAIAAFGSDLLGVAGQAVGQALGFDSVRIGNERFELVSSDVNPKTRLTVSKRLARGFELVFSDNLDDNRLTWIVIYRPRPSLELRASSRDGLANVVEFRQRVAFGPGGSQTSRQSSLPRTRPTTPETVSSVTAVGDPGADVALLLSKLRLKAGSTFEYQRWMQDYEGLRQMFQDRGYYSARVVPRRMVLEPTGARTSRVALEYRVTRGPETDILVSGYPADAALLDRLRLAWFTTAFDEFVPGDLERATREYLLEQGFAVPFVTATLRTLSTGRRRATVLVQAGPQPRRRVVAFSGAHAIPNTTLLALVPTDSDVVLTYNDPQPLRAAILDLYASKGYLSASAQPEPVRVEGDIATLLIRITEGTQASVGTLSVAGVDATRADAVRTASGLQPGAVFVAGDDRGARLRIERFYRDLGYRDAAVAARAAPPDERGRVTVAIQVVEGRQHVIRSVRVEGRDATRQSLVDRAIVLKPGAPAGQQSVSATQRRLYDLGLFRAVDVRFEPVPPPPAGVAAGVGDSVGAGTLSVDAVVAIEEPRKYQFVYGVEFSDQYGPVFDDFLSAVGVAADVRDQNLFGRGLSVSVGGRYERNLASLRSLFAIPTLGGRKIQTNVFGTWTTERILGEGGSALDTETRGGSIEQRWYLRNWLDLSWGYALEYNRRLDVVQEREPGEDPLRFDGTLASLNVAAILDHRDSVFDAKRGWFHASSLQQGVRAMGSDLWYTRYLGRLYYFGHLGPVVSASAVRFGSVWMARGVDPVSVANLLFKAGGSQTVRGYSQDSLSAIVRRDFDYGGSRLLVVNQEIRVSVTRWLGGVVFADAGNTFGAKGIVLRDLAVGLGFGVRITTPLAPLRIDFGFPVPRRPGERGYHWYLSIGQMF